MWMLFALLTVVQAAPDDDLRRTPVVQAIERASPAVLSLEVEQTVESPFLFFSSQVEATSQGSAVLIDDAGIALTNAHVVSGATDIVAHGVDGRSWPATVLGLDETLDLAVIRLETDERLATVEIGTSNGLLLGEPVIALGNPFGLGLTVSTGILSSVEREVRVKRGVSQTYLQTDAAINPGNSGGALVDIHGRLIGINTFIYAEGQGLGFAIPVDRAVKIARDLQNYGSVRAPWLGVDLVDLDPRTVARRAPDTSGAVAVMRVHPGGPAERGGLLPGDWVTHVDGRSVASRADLNAYLAQLDPKAKVELTLRRDEQPVKLSIRCREIDEAIAGTVLTGTLGIDVDVRTLRPGVTALEVVRASTAGTWTQAGFQVGDLLLAVNGEAVRTVDDLRRALVRAKAAHRASAYFTIARGRHQGTRPVDI